MERVYKVLNRENLAVAGVVVQLTAAKITTSVIYARIQVQVAPIRVTEDGTAPAPATPLGEIYNAGDIFNVWGMDALLNLKMVRETATSARVEVTYLGIGA